VQAGRREAEAEEFDREQATALAARGDRGLDIQEGQLSVSQRRAELEAQRLAGKRAAGATGEKFLGLTRDEWIERHEESILADDIDISPAEARRMAVGRTEFDFDDVLGQVAKLPGDGERKQELTDKLRTMYELGMIEDARAVLQRAGITVGTTRVPDGGGAVPGQDDTVSDPSPEDIVLAEEPRAAAGRGNVAGAQRRAIFLQLQTRASDQATSELAGTTSRTDRGRPARLKARTKALLRQFIAEFNADAQATQ